MGLGIRSGTNENHNCEMGVQTPPKSTKMNVAEFPEIDPSPLNNQNKLIEQYLQLERTYTDLLLRNNHLANEKQLLENDLNVKGLTILQQSEKCDNYEIVLQNLKNEYHQNQELYEKEIFYYKELVEELQEKVAKVKQGENKENSAEVEVDDPSISIDGESYNKLLKEYRVLQSNFELEQNSKLVLMDQIEFLMRERERELEEENEENVLEELDGAGAVIDEFLEHSSNSIDVENTTYHMINELENDTSDESEQEEYEEEGESNNLQGDSCLLISSSPLKSHQSRLPSLETTTNFQFPASPHKEEELKRSSLPSKLKTHTSPHLEQDDFVLSPLKLTSHYQGYFEGDNDPANSYSSSNIPAVKRYSSSKPTHSRYNSHDIFPIKVEFEPTSTTTPAPLRSTSVPEKFYKNSVRNSAFVALNGGSPNYPDTSINSSMESLSKRSSLIMDQSMLTNDMTKQEIMKLKFELQSLKLHNEKLLSYIGFELQKQKKNIKKLSHKQSMDSLRNKKMEYSDAKLIEKSKEMLIHKKRVLRSVSINAIMRGNNPHPHTHPHPHPTTTVGGSRRSSGIMSKGLINGFPFVFGEEDEDEDVYGFLNHQSKFNSRLFSNGMDEYYDIDEMSDEDQIGHKKYKSQIFKHTVYDLDEDDDDDDDEGEDADLDQEGEGDITSMWLEEEEAQNGMFKQIKNLFTGNYNDTTKSKKAEELQDETLKYKFFSLAIGIMIIGIRFSHHQSQN